MNKNTPLTLQKGFTITELVLAMGFLTVLMFILLVSSMQLVSTFNKGLTLKRVNQSGRTIGSELQSSLRHTKPQAVTPIEKNLVSTPVTTRVCTGTYSYVWSVYGAGTTRVLEQFTDNTAIGFVKVRDAGGDLCTNPSSRPARANSTELLADGLVIRQPISFVKTDDDHLSTLTYTVSTPDSSDLLFDGSGRGTCLGSRSQDFCALNTFIVTVYSKGV